MIVLVIYSYKLSLQHAQFPSWCIYYPSSYCPHGQLVINNHHSFSSGHRAAPYSSGHRAYHWAIVARYFWSFRISCLRLKDIALSLLSALVMSILWCSSLCVIVLSPRQKGRRVVSGGWNILKATRQYSSWSLVSPGPAPKFVTRHMIHFYTSNHTNRRPSLCYTNHHHI